MGIPSNECLGGLKSEVQHLNVGTWPTSDSEIVKMQVQNLTLKFKTRLPDLRLPRGHQFAAPPFT